MENSDTGCCTPGRKHHYQTENSFIIVPSKKTRDQENMVYIPGGSFLMGTEDGDGFSQDGEGPVREVRVDSFLIDPVAVTNESFREFIDQTGYTTDAERFGWSFVFHLLISDRTAETVIGSVPQAPWWLAVPGADWRHPAGPDSGIDDCKDHPVVHVSYRDGLAYCRWAGKRLPTEAEWEYAARGGLESKKYPWGDDLLPEGEHRCNIWQGEFPMINTACDGYVGTAPVRSYSPNGYGLYNMSGNVWEWCSDWFTERRSGSRNPAGPERGMTKVTKGGSYLCHHSYCNRYRVSARSSNSPDSSTGNTGFRCVADAEHIKTETGRR
ncbi:serine/threonine protein phosphatase [Bhargavaea cecembensis]|uniref:Serine/threonine protein phosphatase n=1 Tax=Bhargavaea cecembensis TaxID=394098 RepID=A0A161RID2_9BACL|nr:formylglycine-generating enzyme family protein [Bhargavaea cecembensis]KZE39892.1 serine/threonine protein phosphatase [Bhargavaea cecembensis]